MAHIQFGDSHCQISGTLVPVADFNLVPGDGVYFSHQMLLWKDPQTPVHAMKMKGGIKRMFAGLPLVMTEATGPGHIAFSRDVPGEMVALPLQAGMAVMAREHHFVVATHTVAYDWVQSNIWYQTSSGNETETHYPMGRYLDVFFAAQAPGLVLLHAAGNAFIRHLQPGQSILVHPASVLFKDTTVAMNLHIEQPYSAAGGWSPWRQWSNRHVWLRLTGPGRVCIQSAFEKEPAGGPSLGNRSSGYTMQRW